MIKRRGEKTPDLKTLCGQLHLSSGYNARGATAGCGCVNTLFIVSLTNSTATDQDRRT